MNRFYKPILITAWLLLFGAFTSTSFGQQVTNLTNAGASPYATIQAAIDNAATVPGDILEATDGTYTEDIVVNKANLTLRSVNGSASTTIQLITGVGINLQGGANNFTLGESGKGFEILSGGTTTFLIQLENAPSDVTIQYNIINTTGNASQGISVGAAGASDLTISNNSFIAEVGDISIWAPDVVNFTVSTNTFTGPGSTTSGVAIEPAGVTGTSSISNNTITGYGTGIFILSGGPNGGTTVVTGLTINNNDVSGSTIGIRLGHTTVTQNISSLTVRNNTLATNTTGLKMQGDPGIFSGTVLINNNSFTGTGTQFDNTTAFTPDATLNWWGDLSGPEHSSNTFVGPTGAGSRVTASGLGTFVRWLNDGTDDDGGAAGFVPSGAPFAPVVNTNDNTYFSSIQAAIDAGTTADGETITAAAGTYTETVTVDKKLTITGTGTPTVTGGFILADSPITITGFNTASTNVVNVQPGGSIQDAIALVNPGGTINVGPGIYDAITISQQITIDGSGIVIINSGSSPITVASTNGATITGATFTHTTDVYAIDVLANVTGTTTITNSNFLNTTHNKGVINRGTGTVNAIHNYWGSPSGPTVASNPGGTGRIVSNTSTGTLLYSPWFTVTGNPPTVLRGVPFLVTPVNGLTGVSIEPTLTWTDGGIPDVGTFTIEISSNGTNQGLFNSNVKATKTGIAANATSYQLQEVDFLSPPLSNNTIYYWQVTVNGGNSDGTKSIIYHFTTYQDLNPLLLWPTDGLTISGDNITFSWLISTPIGSLTFHLQYIQQTDTPTPTEWLNDGTTEAGTSNLFTTLSLTGGLKYHWRVIVKEGTDIVDYSTVNDFTTNGGTSVTLTPTWPTGGVTVYTNNPTLNWYPSLYVPGLLYEVRYALTGDVDPDGALDDGSEEDLALTSDLFTSVGPGVLLPGTEYYWQVRVQDPSTSPVTYGPYSIPTNFTTNGSGTLVIPVPSYPLGGVTVYTTQPTLSWYIGTSGLGLVYDVEVVKSSDAFTGVAGTTPGTFYNDVTTLFQLSDALTPGETYKWQVRSDNDTDQSAFSSPAATFTVSGGVVAAVPVAIWPVGNVSIYSTTPTLSWTVSGSVLGITGYNVRYSTSYSTGTDLVANVNGAATSTSGKITLITDLFKKLVTPLDYGKHYYWVVTSVDGTGESVPTASSVGEFTITGGTGSGTPTLLFPADVSTVYNKKPTFSWYVPGSSNGIIKYELVYSKSDVFEPSVTITETPTVTTFTPSSNLTPGSIYHWKVRSIYATLPASNFSPVFSFTVNPGAAPIQPIVGGPTNNVTVPTSEPTLAWIVNAQVNSSMTYELEIADNENMQNSNVISDITTTYQAVSGLSNDKNYYWRVRSKNADGSYSEYSGTGKFYAKFSVTAVDNELLIPEKFSLEQNYPNPFNPATTIRFALPEASFVILKIYNMLGQEVKTLVNAEKNAGTYNVQWRGDNDFGQKVSSGTYIYRVIAGQNIFVKKMILLK